MSIVFLRTPLAAFDTTMSMRSKCLPSSSNISSTLSGMPTLAWMATARRPRLRISAHSESAASALL